MTKPSYSRPDPLFAVSRRMPVVVLRQLEDTMPTLRALCDFGIPMAEITCRTPCAVDAIRLGRETMPDMLIGAGTVISAEQAEAVLAAGAQFIVSPGLSTEIAAVCRAADIPYIPGCVTPTEVMQAIALGLTTLKFFPAQNFGGLAAIRALAAPFPQVRFVPTGGVNTDNLDDFLACDAVAAVGGSFFVTQALRKGET